jgi:hypothetical protein
MPCAAGSSGVSAVTSVTLTNSTGAIGSFAVVVIRPLLFIPYSLGGVGGATDMIESIVEIKPGACLGLYAQNGGATLMPRVMVELSMVES